MRQSSSYIAWPCASDWAEWFHADLHRRGMVEKLVRLNCSPVVVKGTKLRMLRILSQGLKRRAIGIPSQV
jgi:hypothetical protein